MPTITPSQQLSSVTVLLRPCLECRGPLLLMSVMPAKRETLARLYQCAHYAHIEKVVTSKKWSGWLDSELPAIDRGRNSALK